MNYWLVRAKWGGVNDRTTQFLQNDEWVNGYSDKYLDTVKRVKEGDILLLADNSLINYMVFVSQMKGMVSTYLWIVGKSFKKQ